MRCRLFNGFCLLCDDSAGSVPNLCDACTRELPMIANPCVACGARAIPHTKLCPACVMRPPPIDHTICALAYEAPVSQLIKRLKFDQDLCVVPTLVSLWNCAARSNVRFDRGIDWLVPIPITPSRLRKRGFNQALEIARDLGQQLGIPLALIGDRQPSAKVPQSSLHDIATRRANVKGVFTVRSTITGRVAIVDDVVTTGATVNAFARCLKLAGARQIEVWAIARTP